MNENGVNKKSTLKYEELEQSEEFSFGALGATTVIGSVLLAGVMLLVHIF